MKNYSLFKRILKNISIYKYASIYEGYAQTDYNMLNCGTGKTLMLQVAYIKTQK